MKTGPLCSAAGWSIKVPSLVPASSVITTLIRPVSLISIIVVVAIVIVIAIVIIVAAVISRIAVGALCCHLNLTAENVVQCVWSEVAVLLEESDDLLKVRLQILVVISLEVFLQLLYRIPWEGLFLGHRIVDFQNTAKDGNHIIKTLDGCKGEGLDGSQCQICLLAVGDDFECHLRIALVQSERSEESDSLAHGNMTRFGGVFPQLGGILEGCWCVQLVAGGNAQVENVLWVTAALQLSLPDDIKRIQHLLVPLVVVQKVEEDLVARQLVEEPIKRVVFEQLQRNIDFIEMVEQAHDWRAEHVASKADFFALLCELLDHLNDQINVRLVCDVNYVFEVLGEDQILGVVI